MQNRYFTALAVFLIGFSVETLQYFDIPVLGSTFDPLDYLMYALGALLGLITDIILFPVRPKDQ
jgi:hypothetical protein